MISALSENQKQMLAEYREREDKALIEWHEENEVFYRLTLAGKAALSGAENEHFDTAVAQGTETENILDRKSKQKQIVSGGRR